MADLIPAIATVAVRLCMLCVSFKPAFYQLKGSLSISFATDLTAVR